MFSIASASGVDWQVIWNAEENRRLRDKRKDPSILRAGDVLSVPRRPVSVLKLRAGQENRFVAKLGVRPRLRLELHACGQPRKYQEFVLTIPGTTVDGSTDAQGRIDLAIPPNVRHGTLVIGPDRHVLHLHFGDLDPLDTLSGVQGRLEHLGYVIGNEYGTLGLATSMALRAFQQTQGLSVTGEPDAFTREALANLTTTQGHTAGTTP